MKNIKRYFAEIKNIDRLPSSANGNPRYSFDFETVTDKIEISACTIPDSSLAYNNFQVGDLVMVEIGTHHKRLQINDMDNIKDWVYDLESFKVL